MKNELSIKPFTHYVTGLASVTALKNAAKELARLAPEDHDILVNAFDIAVEEIRYFEPHTLCLGGFDEKGQYSFIVVHYSQLRARVFSRPKAQAERKIIGFRKG